LAYVPIKKFGIYFRKQLASTGTYNFLYIQILYHESNKISEITPKVNCAVGKKRLWMY